MIEDMSGNGREMVLRVASGGGVKRRRKLSPEDKYQIFLETSRGDVPVAVRLRRIAEVGHLLLGPDADKGAGKKGSPGGAGPEQWQGEGRSPDRATEGREGPGGGGPQGAGH